MKPRRALISVRNTVGLVPFAKILSDCGVCIFTGDDRTRRALEDADIRVSPVSAISDYPDMLGGCLHMLHPKVMGGVIFDRDAPGECASLSTKHMEPIDMIVVNMADLGLPDRLDVGRIALVLAARFNKDHVAVVADPMHYQRVGVELATTGRISRETCHQLAEYAEVHASSWLERDAKRVNPKPKPDRVFVH
jgi:phosphoribosylaminoimidazolecarboxamide formyltransferase/IMP cyclohydrolase